jgi:uncharacterized protein (TIGR02757 family)
MALRIHFNCYQFLEVKVRTAVYLTLMELREFLDRLTRQYHRTEFLWSDPLEFVHRYKDPWDQEAVALFASVLAYGNVRQIRKSVDDLLGRMSRLAGSPAGFVRLAEEKSESCGPALKGFAHRFNVGTDLLLLSALLGRSWKEHGSLGSHFLTHLEPGAADISSGLDGLIGDWKKSIQDDPELSALFKKSPSFSYLLTAPQDGSCCKRWCMFLRWMGRKDDLDPGLWGKGSPLEKTFPKSRYLKPSQLVLPLDTHTGRISQYLGLTKRKSLNWLAALEVTASLKECDPDDPSRYDFALARLGILDLCRHRYVEEVCSGCDLVNFCQFARKGRARARVASHSRKSVRKV